MADKEVVILKKINPISAGKVYAVIMAIFGLLYGLLFGVLFSIIGVAGGSSILAGLGVLAIIVFPIIFAIIGFVFGAFSASVYNFAAGKIGGVKLEFEQ